MSEKDRSVSQSYDWSTRKICMTFFFRLSVHSHHCKDSFRYSFLLDLIIFVINASLRARIPFEYTFDQSQIAICLVLINNRFFFKIFITDKIFEHE